MISVILSIIFITHPIAIPISIILTIIVLFFIREWLLYRCPICGSHCIRKDKPSKLLNDTCGAYECIKCKNIHVVNFPVG